MTTPFRVLINDFTRILERKTSNIGDILLKLGECQCMFATYHRLILLHKGENQQDHYNPDMVEIAMLWKVLLNFDKKIKKMGIHLEIELAPFLVCGRNAKHQKALVEEICDDVKLKVKTLPQFVTYSAKRRRRTIAFYFHARRDHTNAIMFKPKYLKSPFVGLHKFDSNGVSKSTADVRVRKNKFPEYSFYINRVRCQETTDFTCTFWSLHWLFWKYTLLIRLKFQPLCHKKMVYTAVDSFRSRVFRFWMQEILHIINPADDEYGQIHPINFIRLSETEFLASQRAALIHIASFTNSEVDENESSSTTFKPSEVVPMDIEKTEIIIHENKIEIVLKN